jgi:mRNA interferase RelE/StbE
MSYRLEYSSSAKKYLKALSSDRRRQLVGKIERLAENPDNPSLDVKKLVEREGFRMRVGPYRILFERYDDRLLILVVAVLPRGQAYRR